MNAKRPSSAAHRVGRSIRVFLVATLLTLLPWSILSAAPAAAGTVRVVAPTGSDTGTGTATSPYRTIAKAFSVLRPGDTLLVHGGTYPERVAMTVAAGTSTAPIYVVAAAGERPVIQGLLWLKGASHWTLDGINVTWASSNLPSEHMVKMTDGTGWRITNAELWGAHSYAALLVNGAPSQWSIDHDYIHDTYKSNSTNQDHLIYVNAGMGSGTIERNVFAHSPNGRGVKIGPPSATSTPLGNVVVRYNTFYDDLGPSNIQLSYSATGVTIYRNIFDKSGSSQPNVTLYNLTGTGNKAYDNVGWQSTGVVGRAAGFTDGGGNFMSDPGFQSTTTDYSIIPTALSTYGRYAP